VGEDIAHPDDLARQGTSGRFSRRSGVMRAAASPMIWSWWVIQFWMSSSCSNASRPRTA
jgi:hypothetical protein